MVTSLYCKYTTSIVLHRFLCLRKFERIALIEDFYILIRDETGKSEFLFKYCMLKSTVMNL